MSKHTPGPWLISYGNDVGPDDDYFVEWLNAGPARIDLYEAGRETAEADARLIALAPEMLEALEEVAGIAEWARDMLPMSAEDEGSWLRARAIIARATTPSPPPALPS